MTRTPTTAVPLNTSLYVPPQQFGELARAVHGSGVVDNLFMWDQITNFWPPHLWTMENAPLAAVIPDIDSYGDAFAMGAYALAAAPGAGVAISTDAIRRGPAELNQTMWTLASMAQGRAILQIAPVRARIFRADLAHRVAQLGIVLAELERDRCAVLDGA